RGHEPHRHQPLPGLRLEIAGDALGLPVAIAGGLGTLAAAHFLGQRGPFGSLPSGLGFGQRPFGLGRQGLVLLFHVPHMGRQIAVDQGESHPMNTMRTGLLLAAMTGLFLAVGYLLGGETGMVIAFLVAAAANLFAYWNADKMVLRMHGAQE